MITRTRHDEAAMYESLVKARGSVHDYINLAVLYWESTDPGIAASSHLSPEFMHLASQTWRPLLELAQAHHPDRVEPELWIRYIDHLERDIPLDASEVKHISTREPDCEFAMFLRFVLSDGAECDAECRRLLVEYRPVDEPSKKYVVSVLDSLLRSIHGAM